MGFAVRTAQRGRRGVAHPNAGRPRPRDPRRRGLASLAVSAVAVVGMCLRSQAATREQSDQRSAQIPLGERELAHQPSQGSGVGGELLGRGQISSADAELCSVEAETCSVLRSRGFLRDTCDLPQHGDKRRPPPSGYRRCLPAVPAGRFSARGRQAGERGRVCVDRGWDPDPVAPVSHERADAGGFGRSRRWRRVGLGGREGRRFRARADMSSSAAAVRTLARSVVERGRA